MFCHPGRPLRRPVRDRHAPAPNPIPALRRSAAAKAFKGEIMIAHDLMEI
jgi:hypothetical protein